MKDSLCKNNPEPRPSFTSRGMWLNLSQGMTQVVSSLWHINSHIQSHSGIFFSYKTVSSFHALSLFSLHHHQNLTSVILSDIITTSEIWQSNIGHYFYLRFECTFIFRLMLNQNAFKTRAKAPWFKMSHLGLQKISSP